MPDLEIDAAELRREGITRVATGMEALDAQSRLAGAMHVALLEQPLDVAADHHPDDVLDRDVGDGGAADELAVAEDG